MYIYCASNDHVRSHRYGWDKIISETAKKITTDIILVDFIDKYFNNRFFEKKTIYYKNNIYNFLKKDAFYYKYDDKKEDVFIYYDEYNFLFIFKWYSEYNDFKLMRGFTNTYDFIKKYSFVENEITKPWIGILHYPEFKKSMNFSSDEEFKNIVISEHFLKSVKNCKCIITLSNHLNTYCKQILKQNKINIDVKTIYHPTDFDCIAFNYNKYIKNKNKKLIQIGFWLRKCDTIYKINTNKFTKYWLPGGEYWYEYTTQVYNNYETLLKNKNVEIKLNLNNETYDELLSENIIILNVFNSSANNTVLECIARNTPILTNNHPAIREYLGNSYPLYYNSIKELNEIINNPNFNKQIKLAHEYLKNLDKTQYNINTFINSIQKIVELHDINII